MFGRYENQNIPEWLENKGCLGCGRKEAGKLDSYFTSPTVYVTWFFSMNLYFKYLFCTVQERYCQVFEVSCLP